MIRLLRSGAAALVLVGALGACSKGDADAGTTATLGTAPTTSTAPADPYAIPETIDAAYVELVLNKLAEVVGDADRIAMRERNVPPEVHDRINAVYEAGFARDLINSLLEDVVFGFDGVIDPPGNSTFSVKEVVEASESCVVAVVEVDTSRVLEDPPAPVSDTVVLHRIDATGAAHEHNPTPWIIANHTSTTPSDLGDDACDRP